MISSVQATILHRVIPGLWISWLFYWWVVASRNMKANQWRETRQLGLAYRIPGIIGVLILWYPSAISNTLREPFLPFTLSWTILAACLVCVGLGFATYARTYLGTNWSGRITLKENHALIRTGPYRLIRHPIYTGAIIALFGTAIAFDQWRWLFLVCFMVISFVVKSRIEESRLKTIFPEYDEYRKETFALIPYVF